MHCHRNVGSSCNYQRNGWFWLVFSSGP